jgi:hypothetical protein
LSLFLEWGSSLLGMSVAQGMLVASTLDKILSGLLVCAPDAPLSALNCLSQLNLDQVCEWNSNRSIQLVERCIHDVIADRIMEQPDAEAICAWDGSVTYRELDIAAGRLAAQLATLGVGPETFVPLCFVKSVRSPPRSVPCNQLTLCVEMVTYCNARRAQGRGCLCAFGSIPPRGETSRHVRVGRGESCSVFRAPWPDA